MWRIIELATSLLGKLPIKDGQAVKQDSLLAMNSALLEIQGPRSNDSSCRLGGPTDRQTNGTLGNIYRWVPDLCGALVQTIPKWCPWAGGLHPKPENCLWVGQYAVRMSADYGPWAECPGWRPWVMGNPDPIKLRALFLNPSCPSQSGQLAIIYYVYMWQKNW